MALERYNTGTGPNTGTAETPDSFQRKTDRNVVQTESRLAALEARPIGGGGGTGTGNVDPGTAALDVPAWDSVQAKYTPKASVLVTDLRIATVDLDASTTLTATTHNDRHLVATTAGIVLSLASSQIGAGLHFLVSNESAGDVTLNFGAGITVRRLAGAAGTGQAVTLATLQSFGVRCFPRGTGFVALVSGTLAGTGGGTDTVPGGGGTSTATVKIDGADSKTVSALPLATGASVGSLSLSASNPAQSFALASNPGGFWQIASPNILRVNRPVTSTDNGTYTLTITGNDSAGLPFSDAIAVILAGTVTPPPPGTTSPEMGVFVTGMSATNVTSYEAWLGKQVDFVGGHQLGAVAGDWNALDPTWLLQPQWLGATGRKIAFTLTMVPDNLGLAGYQEVAAGTHDALYRGWAQAILASRAADTGPIFVRTTWELGASWAPWTPVAQNSTATFINAWRRWADAWHGVSSRFKMVWDFDGSGTGPEAWYPGDAYVDVIAQESYFQTSVLGSDPAAAFQFLVGRTRGLGWMASFAGQHGKPMAISEWGVDSDGGGPFVTALRDWVLQNNVSYMMYWNDNDFFPSYIQDKPNAGAAVRQAWTALDPNAPSPPAPSTAQVKIGGADSKTITALPFPAFGDVGTLTITSGGPAASFVLLGNPGNFWAIQNSNHLTVNRQVTSSDNGSYSIQIGALNAAGTLIVSDAITVVLQGTVTPPPGGGGGSVAGFPYGFAKCYDTDPGSYFAFENYLGFQIDGPHAFAGGGGGGGDFNSINPTWILSSNFFGNVGRDVQYSISMAPDAATAANYATIASGAVNSTYVGWAQTFLGSRSGDSRPIFVRSTWEVAGEWFPWTWAANDDPAAFRGAWTQWCNAWHSVSNRFLMCWDFNGDRGPVEQWYVSQMDVIGQDAYYNPQWNGYDPVIAFQHYTSGTSRGFDWMAAFAAQNGNKPMAVAEWGTALAGDGPGSGWINLFSDWVAANNVAYTSYWNDTAGSGYDSYLTDGSRPLQGQALRNFYRRFQ